MRLKNCVTKNCSIPPVPSCTFYYLDFSDRGCQVYGLKIFLLCQYFRSAVKFQSLTHRFVWPKTLCFEFCPVKFGIPWIGNQASSQFLKFQFSDFWNLVLLTPKFCINRSEIYYAPNSWLPHCISTIHGNLSHLNRFFAKFGQLSISPLSSHFRLFGLQKPKFPWN